MRTAPRSLAAIALSIKVIAPFVIIVIIGMIVNQEIRANEASYNLAKARLNFDCTGDHRVTSHPIRKTPILVICRDKTDMENLKRLDEHVFDKGLDEFHGAMYRAVRDDVFVVIPVSPYMRCLVDYVPRTGNARGWSPDRWFGGFWSLCSSVTFDLAGRQLKPGRFSPPMFPKFVGNLPVPKYRLLSNTEIEFLE